MDKQFKQWIYDKIENSDLSYDEITEQAELEFEDLQENAVNQAIERYIVEAKESADMDDDVDNESDDEEKKDDDEEKKVVKENVNVDIAKELAHLKLNESVLKQIEVVFESALNRRAHQKEKELEESFQIHVADASSIIEEVLTAGIDRYLSYAVDEWMQENKLAAEDGIRQELTESFISDLHDIFEQHYISVPDNQPDFIEKMQVEMVELKEQANRYREKMIDGEKLLLDAQCESRVHVLSEGLTLSEKEKFSDLASGVERDNIDNFTKKIQLLKESYFSGNSTSESYNFDEQSLTESDYDMIDEIEEESDQFSDHRIASYSKAIAKLSSNVVI